MSSLRPRSSTAHRSLLLCLCAYLTGGLAAAPARAETYAFTAYTGDDGLSQLVVQALVQDRDGYLWIGTQAGLNRYDGRRFEIFNVQDDLASDFINDLHEDGEGGLWIAHMHGLSRFSAGHFQNFLPVPEADGIARRVDVLERDHQGHLYCGTVQGLARCDGGAFRRVEALGTAAISALLAASDGRLWIGSSAGLFYLDPDDGRARRAAFALSREITALAEGPRGELWVGFDHSVEVYRDGQRVARYGEDQGVRGFPVEAIHIDRHGVAWLGSFSGLTVIEDGRVRSIDESKGLPLTHIKQVFQDREGILWVGGLGGIAKFLGRPFTTYTERDGLPSSHVRPVLRDRQGALWVGTAKGLARWDGATWQRFTTADGLVHDYILDLHEDRDGRLWIASLGGLQYFQDGSFHTDPAWNSALPHETVTEDHEGRLWLAVRRLGVVRKGARGYEILDIPGQTVFARPRLLVDHRGEVWVSGDRGLSRWDGVRWRTFTTADGLAGPDPYFLREDQDHAIWFGYHSSRGVTRFDRESFRTYTTADGLSNDAVYSIGVDRAGNLWIGTARGVDRFDGERFRNYGTAEGYASQESNAGGFFADRDGTLWFGTAQGLCHYRPSMDYDFTEPVLVRIRRLRFGGEALSAPGAVVPYDRRDLTCEIDVLTFIDDRRVSLRYRLRGYDDAWQRVEGRSIFVPNLPAGDYTLEVQARRYQEPWSPETTISFAIEAPIWRTWWFALACGLVVLALVRFIARITRQKTELEVTLRALGVTQERLETTNRDLERANRVKGELVANVSHELRTPMNAVLGMTRLTLETELTAEQREYLEVVASSGESLLTLINDILDLSRIESGQLVLAPEPFSLRAHLSEVMKTMAPGAHTKGLELLCDIADDLPDEIIGDPHRIRQVLINLIGNAIKFTARGDVLVSLVAADRPEGDAEGPDGGAAPDPRRDRASEEVRAGSRSSGPGAPAEHPLALHLTVRDTGIGIPTTKLSQIFETFVQADSSTTRAYGGSGLGLAITRELVALMQGRVWVESEEGLGSSFHVELPLTAAAPVRAYVPPPSEACLDGCAILLVEDNEAGAALYERVLREAGMRVTAVREVVDARAELARAERAASPFSVILLDLGAADVERWDLARELAEADGDEAPRLVLMTVPGAVMDGRTASRLSLPLRVPRLPKPILPTDLRAAVAKQVRTQAEVRQRRAESEARAASPDLRVLVVEDNPISQRLMQVLLSGAGHEVTVVGDGYDAVVAIQAASFDVVLMDIQMPRMDGLEATRRIRLAERGSGRHVPIIALTANTLVGDREQCLRAGMDEYMPKPIRGDDLLAVIERTCASLDEDADEAERDARA